ncbi:LysR family transcriptional regulator [Sphingomonas sp. PL-96]|uniref:LysR family transcriptional regulator n=1 Tax=Sphingomonas sp. PL-96 TaxID=2887201 RepID=UPI001E5AEE5F|nr:LysR family transcriptional regulator [Sphingomonas sp. PL-96]MCC2976662.1 LysR family transcriptional regulator [Sphingomonas sp. PL-96]
MNSLDWALLRSFLAVLDSGSLSTAAGRIDTTQPTLSRHIRALEAVLGFSLFTRSVRGLEPTEAALALADDARCMGAAAEALALKASGRSEELVGTVRIAASVVVANLVLPPIVAALRQDEPSIQIEIAASDTNHNLLRRDADIAIRMAEPVQESLIARRLGNVPIGLFAARSYLARRGTPRTTDDLTRHDVIGFDRGEGIVRAYAANGLSFGREDFPVRCDDQMVSWHLLLAGVGLGFAQVPLATDQPDLKSIDVGLRLSSMPVWLVMHDEVRTNARIRRIADVMSIRLAGWLRSG